MKKLILLSFALLLNACVSNQTNMSLIVPEGVKFNSADITNAKVTKNISSSSSAPVLVVIPLGQPNFETVVKNILKQGNGDVLINARINEISQWYILFGFNKIEITADVVNIPNT